MAETAPSGGLYNWSRLVKVTIMALSVLRHAARPALAARQQSVLMCRVGPMATSAREQMDGFWRKNEKIGRPVSPWINYKWQLPMLTSLGHRFTGISMGLVLYGGAIGLYLAPENVTHYVDALAAMEMGPMVWFPLKSLVAFPLIYHYINAIRHYYWDFKGGYEVAVQLKTGVAAYAVSTILALLAGGASYMF